MSWAEVRSPVMQRLETFFSRCWLSLITCKIKSSRVFLSFCVTSLLSVHWPEVMSRQKIVSSMCHFLSPCMTLLPGNTSVEMCCRVFFLLFTWILILKRSSCLFTRCCNLIVQAQHLPLNGKTICLNPDSKAKRIFCQKCRSFGSTQATSWSKRSHAGNFRLTSFRDRDAGVPGSVHPCPMAGFFSSSPSAVLNGRERERVWSREIALTTVDLEIMPRYLYEDRRSWR